MHWHPKHLAARGTCHRGEQQLCGWRVTPPRPALTRDTAAQRRSPERVAQRGLAECWQRRAPDGKHVHHEAVAVQPRELVSVGVRVRVSLRVRARAKAKAKPNLGQAGRGGHDGPRRGDAAQPLHVEVGDALQGARRRLPRAAAQPVAQLAPRAATPGNAHRLELVRVRVRVRVRPSPSPNSNPNPDQVDISKFSYFARRGLWSILDRIKQFSVHGAFVLEVRV